MIEVRSISKTFRHGPFLNFRRKPHKSDPRQDGRHFHVLTDISFVAEPGTIMGLIGPNGAGKTTLLRLLSTAIKPTSGTAIIDNCDIVQSPLEVRKRQGFLSGSTGLYGRLTAREIMRFFARLHQIPQETADDRIAKLFEMLQITEYADKPTDKLSTGMKQKVSIARTLIHDPQVLIFDEPTTGLDVVASQTILRLIKNLRDEGRTVIFSTHHMHEVANLCDSVVLINQGRQIFSGSTAAMLEAADSKALDKAFLKLINHEEL